MAGANGTVDAGLDKKSVPLAADDILLNGWGLPFQSDTEGRGIMGAQHAGADGEPIPGRTRARLDARLESQLGLRATPRDGKRHRRSVSLFHAILEAATLCRSSFC
jgi:hypothetical protein